jgi:hypothetical protein
MIYFYIFFGLSSELETDQASQPLAPCPLNLAWKNKEWTKVGSKWNCKVGTYIVTYCAKWLLTKHFKEVRGLMAEKAKRGRPSSSKRSPRHQDHVKMNAHILGNVMDVQKQNDQKVVNCVCAKARCEWDKLIIVAEQCPLFPKPTLVTSTLKQLL